MKNSSLTGAHERTFGFAFDAAERLAAETTPLGHTARHEYDAEGNRIALKPAGRPAHRFGYTTRNLTDTWDPPAVEGVTARLEAQYT